MSPTKNHIFDTFIHVGEGQFWEGTFLPVNPCHKRWIRFLALKSQFAYDGGFCLADTSSIICNSSCFGDALRQLAIVEFENCSFVELLPRG
jgi:hypothetical protein